MKIVRLDLRAFGPFSEVALDLSGGQEGLHVIYGPNEAGKSSSLRALQQLFFGIPSRCTDNFLHPYDKLRLGAVLRRRDGATLEFLRRKAAKKTLLAADNATFLDDSALRPFLDGLDKDLFATMFGIGHAELVEGGQEIVHGRGDVGQLLFAAGAGIADLRGAREKLDAEAATLFKPRGQTQRINQQLRALDEARAKIRDAQLHSDDWVHCRKNLEDAQARLADVESRLQQSQRETHRLERIREALPIIAKRKECRAQLAALAGARILPVEFAERRREAVTNLTLACKAEQNAREEIDRIDQQLCALVIPEAVLAQAKDIEPLQDVLGSHRKAQRDLPGLVARKEQLEHDAAAKLRELRPDLTLDAADQVRLTRSQQVEIQNLGGRLAALVQQARRAQTEIEESTSSLVEVQQQLAGVEAAREAGPLKAAVRRVQGQGDLEEQRERVVATLRAGEEQAAIDLARLRFWSGTLEQLETLALPTAETIDRYESELAEAERQIRAIQEKRDEADAGQADFDRQIEQLRLEGDVPTEDDLAAARQLRDRGWQLVLNAWKSGGPNAAAMTEFLDHFPGGGDLAIAYRQAVDRADELSDRLRREANRVATRASLQASRDALARQLATLVEPLGESRRQRDSVEQSWLACWRVLGIEAGRPREMRTWLARQKTLVEQAQTLRAQRDQVRQLDDRIQACRRQLNESLAGLNEPPAGATESLAALVDRCAATVERIETAAARRRQLEQDLRQWSHRLAAAKAAAGKAEAEQSQWRGQWAVALEPLGLAPETTPAAANEFVARVGDLFDSLKQAEGFAERIERIHYDAEGFGQQVQDVVRKVDAALAARPAEQAAEELIARLRKAAADQQNQEALRRQRSRYSGERDKAQASIDRTTALLAAMCQEAGCERHEMLPEAERASDAARRLRQILESLDDQLLSMSSGAAIDAFLAEAEAIGADELPVRMTQLDEQTRELEAEKKGLLETIGSTRNELGRMDAGAAAADAAEEVQELLAEIESDARQYARLRLTLAVLRDGIERYRRKNEGPILGRASDLFRQLTRGSFERLRADVDEQGENVLVGVRPGGAETVGLAGMSDGTGDQLYLALRLASLENYLAEREPIPFVVDDILISFDDARSLAALEVLADFSRRTQIIFFTHHQHLIELARANLNPDVLFVHRLREE